MTVGYSLRRRGTAGAAHRTRLRFFDVDDGHLTLTVQAELLDPTRPAAGVPLGFVRDGHRIHPADPIALPGAVAPVGDGRRTGSPDITDALARTRMWIMLRDRRSAAEAYAATDVEVEFTPEVGPPRRRRFTVRFAAHIRFDLLAALAPEAGGTWDVFTVLESVGSRSTAPLGAVRDRVPVDAQLRPVRLRSGLWLDPQLTGFGPRLTLEIG